MKQLIFIRHPETEENIKDIQQSHYSSNFTKTGKMQLISMKNYLKNKRIDFCYSSDSPRCTKTVKILIGNSEHCQINIFPLLRDKSKGLFEGLKNSEIDWSEINKASFENRKVPGGESLRDVKERIVELVEMIKKLPENSTILLVSHSLTLRLLIGYLKNLNLKESVSKIRIDNCTFSMGELEKDKFKIVSLNKKV